MATPTDVIQCECGESTGEQCAWAGCREETEVVEWLPPYLAGTAEAARSRYGLTRRLRVHVDCAERLREAGEVA